MRNHKLKILFFSIFLFLSSFSFSIASSTGIDVDLKVGSCNNNGRCEKDTEDIFYCPSDCKSAIIGGSVEADYFRNLTVKVSYNSATIEWQSAIPVTSNINWGTNPDYKDGVIRNGNFLVDHKVTIDNLSDGTLYYFNIQAESLLGKNKSIENQTFQTLLSPDTTPPGNPTNIKMQSGIPGITISWNNPTDKDFDYIRVMRNSDKNISPYNGKLVYEGKGSYFTDSKVKEGIKYFYSLFSRDRSRNYSSGAFVEIIYSISGKNIIISPPTEVENPEKEGSVIVNPPIQPEGREKSNLISILWIILLILLILILLFLFLRKNFKKKE